MQIPDLIREWIVTILETRAEVLDIAIRQRAKFEGWLKFELAVLAESKGAIVSVEAPYGDTSRADVSVTMNGCCYFVELKTPNTNWRIGGVQNKHRPITKNIRSVADDAAKFVGQGVRGVVAFVLFPVPVGDCRWHKYLRRIGEMADKPLTEERHCSRVKMRLRTGQQCEAVVCCFEAT